MAGHPGSPRFNSRATFVPSTSCSSAPPTEKIAVEVITRLSDLQAQIRASQLKSRDIGATRLILAVAGTHANRRALNEARLTLVSSFDLDSRRIVAELAAGRDPGRDGIVVL